MTQHHAETTESDQILQRVKPRRPLLRLLFSAGSIVKDTPPYPLTIGKHQIGRDLGRAVGLALSADRRASRVHAEISVSHSATPIELADADSKNGVFVNGERSRRAVLSDGDLIRIGDSLLLVRYEPDDGPGELVSGMVGISAVQRTLSARLRSVAPSDSVVLLLGESGTGKDLCARSLHAESRRRGPLVSVNCAAVPDSLAESQFFGHASGSFTGAQKPHTGFFLAANEGTLFLDEIGELSPRGQALLLRALEERAVTPVGATSPLPCSARILSATNRDLPSAVAQGIFRGDLYARLCGIIISLVPLRQRREDILLLLSHAMGNKLRPMTARLAEALLLYPYPWNVRELHQLAVHLSQCDADLLDLPHIADRLSSPLVAQPQPTSSTETPETPVTTPVGLPKQPLSREVLERLLTEHQGIISRVAQAAGRSRRQVMRWLSQYQIDAETYKP